MTVTLHHGDCVDYMRSMDEGAIDLTVTSPPYDNLRTYGKDFDADTFDWKSIIAELYRVTKTGGVVVWVVADATIKGSETGTSFRQALWAMECGFNLHDTMIYHKRNPMPYQHNRYQPCHEYMFVLSNGSPKTFEPIRIDTVAPGGTLTTTQRGRDNKKRPGSGYGTRRNETRFAHNVWSYNVGLGQTAAEDYAFEHPAIFPESLARDHILSWSNPGDTVFDPMMGSGTTGKMAVMNGRHFIGCDLEAEYVEIARRRIAEAQAQPSLLEVSA